MAHVREVAHKGDRAYEVRWKDAGRDRQRTFTQKREADRFAAKVENTIAGGATTTPLVRRTKIVAEVVAASLAASQPRLKASTYRSYVQGNDRYVLPTFGGKRIAAVTSEHVEAWVTGLQKSGLAPASIRNQYVGLTKVMKYAVRHRLSDRRISSGAAAAIDRFASASLFSNHS